MHYASAVIIIVFGAWFAQVLIQTGIAESVIRSAVELAGDRPLVTAMTITLVTALLFTSMYGVGAAIAIGVIALPIMMSQGIPPHVAAPVFTMGIGAGTFINLVQFGTFQKLFPGLKYEAPYLTYWVVGMCVYILAAWMLAFFYLRNDGARRLASVDVAGESAAPVRKRTPYYTYIVPIFPVIMILVLKWEIIPTFIVSILLALALTWPDRTLQGHLNLFNKTFSDAFPDIATIAALWTICGMIIVAGQTPEVAGALEADLRADPAAYAVAGRDILRTARRYRQHLSGADGRHRHRRGLARHHPRQQGDTHSVSLFDLARADGAAREHGSDQLMDVVDDRAHQGQPWTVPAHRPALRLPHGRSQFVDLLPDAGLAAIDEERERWLNLRRRAAPIALVSTSEAPSPRPS